MTNHKMSHSGMGADPMGDMDMSSMGHGPTTSGATCDPDAERVPPTCGVHNQMMVGTQTIYLSHLPMFMFDPEHREHNFQVILEVTLNGPGNAQATYVNDRTSHPTERMYTMSPAPFEMIELDPRHPRRQE